MPQRLRPQRLEAPAPQAPQRLWRCPCPGITTELSASRPQRTSQPAPQAPQCLRRLKVWRVFYVFYGFLWLGLGFRVRAMVFYVFLWFLWFLFIFYVFSMFFYVSMFFLWLCSMFFYVFLCFSMVPHSCKPSGLTLRAWCLSQPTPPRRGGRTPKNC